MPGLILASSSQRRIDLLCQVGLKPTMIMAADIDETPIQKELPRAYALRMAKEKTLKIYSSCKENFILGADTVVSHGRTILPKAESGMDVKLCLEALSGRRHNVLTAICIITPEGKVSSKLVTTRVCFKHLTTNEIDTYVKSTEGLGKAGGYAIQGIAGCFVKRINGSYSSIVGLPLYETYNMLTGLGYVHK